MTYAEKLIETVQTFENDYGVSCIEGTEAIDLINKAMQAQREACADELANVYHKHRGTLSSMQEAILDAEVQP